MADNIIKVNVTSVKQQRVSVSSSQVGTEITASGDTGRFWAQTAKNWAVSDVIVDNTDYSSKHYALEAKESAQNASNFENATRETYNSFLETSANANQELQATKDNVLTEIDNSKTNAVDSINSAKTTVLNDIEFVADGEKKEIQELSEETQNKIINLGIDTRANVDLSNLSEDGEKHFLNKSQITNCITEIPQRIKYTLENGTLTIKAGSVVIVPYGTEDLTSQYPKGARFLHDNFKVYDTQYVTNTIESYKNKFFVWAELQNDVKLTGAGTITGQCPLMLSITNNSFAFNDLSVTGSGADHTADTKNYTYYNTTLNNVYKRNNPSSAWFSDVWALPLGTFTRNAGTITSLDQVFNGFGYIGTSIWIDKDVKCLIPDGRNEDGTLKNIEYAYDKLWIKTMFLNGEGSNSLFKLIYEGSSDVSHHVGTWGGTVINSTTKPTPKPNTYILWYNPETNKYMQSNLGGDFFDMHACYLGVCNKPNPGNMTELIPREPFRAVDYQEASGLSMPSSNYIDLILGASGTTYTAPANGFYYVSKASNANNQYLTIGGEGIYTRSTSSATNQNLVEYIPVKKGGVVSVNYSLGGTTNTFRFIYAQGEV